MSGPEVEVVIAVHDVRRPVRRAVESLQSAGPAGSVRGLVIAHGLPASDVERSLEGLDPASWRIVPFTDGIQSPAGPFNHGLTVATAPWVMVMGSDDYLEPGAVEWMLRRAHEDEASVVIAPQRHQTGERIESPLVRRRRTRNLDPVRDRMFYRTAPLALIRRELVETLTLRFDAAHSTGDDLSVGVRLWSSRMPVSYHRLDPAYIVGADAPTRVTTVPRRLTDSLAPVRDLVQGDLARGLPRSVRRALAVKVIRIHLLGALRARSTAIERLDADEWDILRQVLASSLELSPNALAPFTAAERQLLDLGQADCLRSQVAAERNASPWRRLIPRNPLRAFDRESTLRRYLVYALYGSRRGGMT